CSRSTSSANFVFFTQICKISRQSVGPGITMTTSRSNQPNRRRAGSIECGRLVAAMMTTFEQ
ncbi:hypothetical protein BT96DRAFT_743918, partial [Gymnopus androsaceus JB14]